MATARPARRQRPPERSDDGYLQRRDRSAAGRRGGGETARLGGRPRKRLAPGHAQGAGVVAPPTAHLGTRTPGGLPAGRPGVRATTFAGRRDPGGNDGADG